MNTGEFELDGDGNVVTRPLLGYTIVGVANTAVVARLWYSETPEDIGTGGKAVQIVLTPQVALEIAEVLTRQAKRILGQPVPGEKN